MLNLGLRKLILREGAKARSEGANLRSERINTNVRELLLVLILFKGANPRSERANSI